MNEQVTNLAIILMLRDRFSRPGVLDLFAVPIESHPGYRVGRDGPSIYKEATLQTKPDSECQDLLALTRGHLASLIQGRASSLARKLFREPNTPHSNRARAALATLLADEIASIPPILPLPDALMDLYLDLALTSMVLGRCVSPRATDEAGRLQWDSLPKAERPVWDGRPKITEDHYELVTVRRPDPPRGDPTQVSHDIAEDDYE